MRNFVFAFSIQFNTKIKYDFKEGKNAFFLVNSELERTFGEYVLENLCFGFWWQSSMSRDCTFKYFVVFILSLSIYEWETLSRKYSGVLLLFFSFLFSLFLQKSWQNLTIIFYPRIDALATKCHWKNMDMK